MSLRLKNAPPWRVPLPTALYTALVTKSFRPPKDGWTASEFATHGARLMHALDRVAKTVQRKAVPVVARRALALFERQLDETIARALRRAQRARALKSGAVEIILPQDEGIWMQALNEVFAELGIEATAELVPPVQSVLAQGYSRTSDLLAQPGDPEQSLNMTRFARDIAEDIVGINETTRDQFRKVLESAIQDGLTTTETADRMRDKMGQNFRHRVNTIARTEVNNAYTRGALAAYQESRTLTHVSVIGCESRERERWNSPSYQPFMYRGESTCNIVDVPVHDAHLLNFHPNHTGTLVPSKFRNRDGSSGA